ncbi:PREDICTED: stabilin-1 [Nanorana parkeri]|uniref:stabilin-1 n=1 Tax=Nanorana parkeri TaxID=125878 RepID=UPI000854EF79|nr:PREDICTED: stabilin-1 [Nanorana parkeri]
MGGVVLSMQGCSHTCQTVILEPACCKGFWGSTCSECPGGSTRPCSGHGVCMEGLNGNGTYCQCKRGICNNGIKGDGSCTCEAGYMGSTCELESLSCKALNCGVNARCVQSGTNLKCDCMPVYKKLDGVCKPEDPCKSSPCNTWADCKVTGPRQYTCTCKSGYYGDGKTCLAFNPCSINNGGCPENTTKCVYRSPGKSYCSCLPGLISRGAPSQCTMPDVCRSLTCGKSAHCEVVSPGKHKCVCMEGEIGDGRNCYGSLLYEIQKFNIESTDLKKQSGALRVFEEGCALALRKFGPFTVFVPLMKASQMNETTAKLFCKAHIVAGLYLNYNLKDIGELWTIGGDILKFSGLYIMCVYATLDPQRFTKSSKPIESYIITKLDLPAANGIIHVINKVIEYDNTEVIRSQSQMTIGDILATDDRFSRFETLLENCDLPLMLNGHGFFTVFVPSNKAVDSLRDGRLIYLLTQAKHKLLELVKYHISSVASVTLDRLITMPHIVTTSNEMIKINVTHNGRILFGDPGIPLIHSDIIASNGVIHVLDGILIPSGILPILPSKCNETLEEIIQGPCSNCDSIAPCPNGTIDLVLGCCHGFFGPDCKLCPAGFYNPCYGRGSCNSGIRGNGKCVCFEKYKGIACHICSDPNKHGDECEEDCRCVHGTCDNRPGSKGVCQGGRCKDDYVGDFCDQHSEPCKSLNVTQFCHLNAVCVSTDGNTRCQCKNGYEGDGTSCQPVDDCKKPERGGCSENAICISAPTGVMCQCNPGWSGDGIECIPIDNCVLEDRGGCHVDADCHSTQPGKNDCICKKGYAGDGYSCDPVNICLQNNGGCNAMAKCNPTSGGERTCTCPEGFAGDGLACYGDILLELLRIPEVSIFSQWLTYSEFRIRIGSNVTALIPSDTAIMALTQEDSKFWMDSYMMPFLIRAHFLQEAYSSDQLKQHANEELSTLDPRTKWEIRIIEGNLTINNARVITQDIPASNGFIFIIGQVLMPPLGNIPPRKPGLLQKLEQNPSWEEFKLEMQKSGLVQEIEASQHYTIFVPDNSAIKKFYNQSGLSNMDNSTIKYHIILGEKLMPADLMNGMHRSSMLGLSDWLMFFKRYNQTFVHDIPLDGNFYETKNGMLMGISDVLKVLNNRCDISVTIEKKIKCSACGKRIQCPEGTDLEEPPGTEKCLYKRRNKEVQGCRYKCIFTKVTPQCCTGYYGHQCILCSGGLNNSCSNNGKCQDSITGTGECICKEGFHGTACETCEPGRYGADCKADCDCIHGKCNDGLHGDGLCQCDKGWTGSVCDIDINNDLCNGTCSLNANCIPGPKNTTGKCFCLAGYTGNGTHCTEIDVCAANNGGCSVYANCTKAPLGQARCTCIDGYSGDGIICFEIDACLENNGGCHPKAECTKTGPNKVACNCLPGYKGNGTQSCQEINICDEDNGGCSPYAICIRLGRANRYCICKRGFLGDGMNCTGNIAETLQYNKDAYRFNWLNERYNIKALSGEGPFTVFVPLKEAIENSSTIAEWTQNQLIHLLRYHLVGCQQLLLDELMDLSSVTPMSGGIITFSTKNDEVYLNDFAKIIKSLLTNNGVIHFIDKVLIPKIPTNASSSLLGVSQAAMLHGYSTFAQLLKESNLHSVLKEKVHQPFTMLWPTDEAFNSMPAERKRWLYHEDHKDKLMAYLKVHIIRDTKITAASLPEAKLLRTLYGSKISFQCSTTNIGDILLNENSAKIIQRDLEFTEGIAHGIDQLLEPPNIGARCDEYAVTTASSTLDACSICGFESPCPYGTVDRGETESCIRSRSRFGAGIRRYSSRYQGLYDRYRYRTTGCRKKCYSVSWEPRCCKNHFGGDCHVCPGGLEAPCSNHGTCVDGIAGTGQCICTEGFNGTACELCTPNRYGPDCKECTCTQNGQCSDGISGDGSCFCAEGWTGQNCDIKLMIEPICAPDCDGNATCRTDNECECNPYYEGDGRTCNVIDQCKNYNGGCSVSAQCSQAGIKVSCACLPGYEGDGYVCTPIDLCANGENGGCSEHATCFYTGPNTRRCECHDGYVGNGVQCLEKYIPPVDRCLQENGGCDPLATCTDLHYEEKTAGVFHLQSPKGKYQLTYEEAVSLCSSEGASIATFQQLSAAQQVGYHRCLVGWLFNRTAGYPTVYPSVSCGSNHVGIVDYKQRTNLSETWDVYCYRFKDADCDCPDGYVGDGSFCNGNLLEVLQAYSKTSTFYSMILDYSNSSSQGAEFLDMLVNRTSYRTLFVPEDSSFDNNVTLTWRDLEHHISKLDILVPYSNLTNGTTLLSNTGYNLSISEFLGNCSQPPCPKVVNNKIIILWDIPAFNGIIHIIDGPLIAPLIQEITDSHISHPVTAGLVTVMVIALIAASVGYLYYRKQNDGFHFTHFKGEDDDLDMQNVVNPPLVTFPNPVYGANCYFDQFEEPYNDGDEASDISKILH